ncbi:MAG: ATPase [Oscillospiraceae bacterium]|jgi:vacuolar-type H+-ATPase subunit H|nr:ATPase [Oscillospiraceae bacterium]
MTIEEILDSIEDMLEKSWGLPLSGGRGLIDVERLHDMVYDIRKNIPVEIKHAKAIVADRADIIQGAKHEAEEIIKKAEDRARRLVHDDEITKQAREKATEILSAAHLQSHQMKKAASDFAERILGDTERVLASSFNEVKTAKQELKSKKK